MISGETESPYETFFLLKNKDKFDVSEYFHLKGSMELCFGLTVFEVNIENNAVDLPLTNLPLKKKR